MSATVSTDFLLRVAQATPEQQADIEAILRRGESGEARAGRGRQGEEEVRAALMRIERKVDGLAAAAALARAKGPLQEAECLRVFRLFGELMSMGTELVASPARVFDLMVFKRLTKAETAVACKCAASLITRRVGAIEGHFGMSMERLSDFASDIKERRRTVKGDLYVKKKDGGVRDEVEQYDDGDSEGLEEDEDGYLPEEGPGWE